MKKAKETSYLIGNQQHNTKYKNYNSSPICTTKFTELLELFKPPQIIEIISSWSYGNTIFLSMKNTHQHLNVLITDTWLFRAEHTKFSCHIDNQAAEVIHNTVWFEGAERKAQPLFQFSLRKENSNKDFMIIWKICVFIEACFHDSLWAAVCSVSRSVVPDSAHPHRL